MDELRLDEERAIDGGGKRLSELVRGAARSLDPVKIRGTTGIGVLVQNPLAVGRPASPLVDEDEASRVRELRIRSPPFGQDDDARLRRIGNVGDREMPLTGVRTIGIESETRAVGRPREPARVLCHRR